MVNLSKQEPGTKGTVQFSGGKMICLIDGAGKLALPVENKIVLNPRKIKCSLDGTPYMKNGTVNTEKVIGKRKRKISWIKTSLTKFQKHPS